MIFLIAKYLFFIFFLSISIYFAKKKNSDVKKIFWNKKIINFPQNPSMSLNKLNKIISKKIK